MKLLISISKPQMKIKLKTRALDLKNPVAVTFRGFLWNRRILQSGAFFVGGGSKSMDNMTPDELTEAIEQELDRENTKESP